MCVCVCVYVCVCVQTDLSGQTDRWIGREQWTYDLYNLSILHLFTQKGKNNNADKKIDNLYKKTQKAKLKTLLRFRKEKKKRQQDLFRTRKSFCLNCRTASARMGVPIIWNARDSNYLAGISVIGRGKFQLFAGKLNHRISRSGLNLLHIGLCLFCYCFCSCFFVLLFFSLVFRRLFGNIICCIIYDFHLSFPVIVIVIDAKVVVCRYYCF